MDSLLVCSKGNAETSFLEQIRSYTNEYFPDCDKKSYRIPAIHFASERLKRRGEYFLRYEQEKAVLEGENAEKTVIEILEKMRDVCGNAENEPMFLICGFKFENYLNKFKDGNEQIVASKKEPVEGQHDILLLHLMHGVTFIQVKAIGEFPNEVNEDEDQKTVNKRRNNHNRRVKEYVQKALEQLRRDEKFFNDAMKDIHPRFASNTKDKFIRKILALPNIRKEYLVRLNSTMDLLKEYFGMDPLAKCICMDEHSSNERDRQTAWWESNMKPFPCFVDVDSYKQVIGRYCGLLSTVDVPYAKADADYRKFKPEIRTKRDAAKELAYRSMRIVLTPEQVNILDSSSERLKIYGTYGTGKTIMLILKARELVRKREHVLFFNKANLGKSLLDKYFSQCVRAGLDKDLHKYVNSFIDEINVEMIQSQKRIHLFIDECIDLLETEETAIMNLPHGCVCWIAHNATKQTMLDDPGWDVEELNVVLRNPQYIQDILKGREEVDTLFKVDHTKHTPCEEKHCASCDEELHSALREIGLFEDVTTVSSECSQLDQAAGASPKRNLTWSDVVCFVDKKDIADVKFFSRKQIPYFIPSEFARNQEEYNKVIVTIPSRFLGLERKVVITTLFNEDTLLRQIAISRCTSCLILVNKNTLT